MIDVYHQQTYFRDKSAVFLKTAERFGGLSNMAGGYPLSINGIRIPTSEALYQACRFPHKSDVQKIIIGQKSPMTAKMKSKPFRKESRPDWDEQRVEIMWWCLRVKLAQHWQKFGDLLLSTENKPIVEESYRDQFWGAKPDGTEILVGLNVLGNLLTDLREELKGPNAHKLQIVEPPPLPQFLLINKGIEVVKVAQEHLSIERTFPQQYRDLFSFSQDETPSVYTSIAHTQPLETLAQNTIDVLSNPIPTNISQLQFQF